MQMPELVPLLFFGGFLIFLGVIMRVAVITSRKARENMQRLAEQLHLQVKASKPVMGFHRSPEATGSIRGKTVRIYNYTTGTSKSKTIWAAVAVITSTQSKLTFKLSHQGFGTKVKEVFGAKEITVGRAEFDESWFIQTNAPEFFRAALLPEVQEKIQHQKGTWKLEAGVMHYAERGSFTDPHRCERFAGVVDAACDLADIAEVYAQQAKS